jgi:hypothetical protein
VRPQRPGRESRRLARYEHGAHERRASDLGAVVGRERVTGR